MGNTFRSRLAEAYLRSKKIPNVDVSSSGVRAHENKNGPVCWYTVRLIKRHHLIPHLTHTWTKTTPTHLKNADIVIFMDKKHHEHSKNDLGFTGSRYEIWNIPDLDNFGVHDTGETLDEELATMRISEKVYKLIIQKVNRLITSLGSL